MVNIPFVKYQGAGNDFVLIDLQHLPSNVDLSALSQRICERRRGVGADGLLILSPSSIADYRMRIFNADGSEPSMCGNGIRCLFDFIQKQKAASLAVRIETTHGILKCRKVGDHIAVNLGSPYIMHWPIELLEGDAYVLNTGVPHAVFFVDDLEKIDVDALGRKIRNDSRFAPQGVNVNFARIENEGKVFLRTYERGIEAETLACGTGAAAAAFAAMERFKLPSPVSILTRRSFAMDRVDFQEHLRFLFPKAQGQAEIEMLGHAVKVFEGTLDL